MGQRIRNMRAENNLVWPVSGRKFYVEDDIIRRS